MSGDITHEGACITDIRRMTNSVMGNPRFKITFVTMNADVITAQTQTNASVNYEITDGLVDSFATITRTRAGRIWKITRER